MVNPFTFVWRKALAFAKRIPWRVNKAISRLSGLRPYLAGAQPGLWSADHLEESQHYQGWQYCAIRAQADQFAQSEVKVYQCGERIGTQRRMKRWDRRLKSWRRNTKTRRRTPLWYKCLGAHGRKRWRETFLKDFSGPGTTLSVKPERLELPDHHPIKRLLLKPNPDQSWAEFSSFGALQMRLTGSALVWTVRNEIGVPREMYILPTAAATPMPPTHDHPHGAYRVSPLAAFSTPMDDDFLPPGALGPLLTTGDTVDARDVKRISLHNPLYLSDGYSPLYATRMWTDLAEQADRSRWSQIKNAVVPGLVLELAPDANPSQDSIDAFRADLRARQAGTLNAGKDLVLPEGLTAKQLEHTQKEMDYVQTFDQLRNANLAAQKTPPVAIGVSEAGSYAAYYASMKQFTELSVQPDMDLFAGCLTSYLGPLFERSLELPRGQFFLIEIKAKAHDDPSVKAEEERTKDARIQTLSAAKIAKVNELRVIAGLPPLSKEEGGEEIAGKEQPASGMQQQVGPDGKPLEGTEQGADETSTGVRNPAKDRPGGGNPFKSALAWEIKASKFDEQKHPRGQPGNPGQFGSGGGSASSKKKPSSKPFGRRRTNRPARKLEANLSNVAEKTKDKYADIVSRTDIALPLSVAYPPPSALPVGHFEKIVHSGWDAFKKTGVKATEIEEVAKQWASEGIDKKVGKLTGNLGVVAAGVWKAIRLGNAALSAAYRASQSLAESVARAKGASPEEASKFRSLLACADVNTFRLVSTPMLGLTGGTGLPIVAALSQVPIASMTYLIASAAENPRQVASVAWDKAKAAFQKFAEATREKSFQEGNSKAQDFAEVLYDSLYAHQGDEEYLAVLCAAFDMTTDLRRALEIADIAFKDADAQERGQKSFAEPRSFSTTQFDIPVNPRMNSIGQRMLRYALDIPDDLLAGHGRESHPHITIHAALETERFTDVQELISRMPPVRVRFAETALFKNPEADVLHVKVESADLEELHGMLAALPNGNAQSEFRAHATIAYLKPSEGSGYAGDYTFAGEELIFNTLAFIDRYGRRTNITLNGYHVVDRLGLKLPEHAQVNGVGSGDGPTHDGTTTAVVGRGKSWDESKHPRGQPDNPGQFGSSGSSLSEEPSESKSPMTGWGGIEADAYEEPKAKMSEVDIAASAKQPGLPLPQANVAEPERLTHAWGVVSRLWPEMASKIKKITEYDPKSVPKGIEPPNAFVDPPNAILAVKPGADLQPETLWHELVHFEQYERGDLKPRNEMEPDAFNALEQEARQRAAAAVEIMGRLEQKLGGKKTGLGKSHSLNNTSGSDGGFLIPEEDKAFDASKRPHETPDPGTPITAVKLDRSAFAYTDHAKNHAEECRKCRFFDAPDLHCRFYEQVNAELPEKFALEVVVSPDGWCESFERTEDSDK